MVQVKRAGQPSGPQGRDDSYQPSASIWPLVAVAAAAIALPGLVHGVPPAAQVGFVASGLLVGSVAVIGWIRDDLLAPKRAARWRLVMTPADPPAPYSPLNAGPRSDTREALHLRALQDIARFRFNYPTNKYRDFKTYLNLPQNTMGVQMPGGSVAYPDIVVIQSPEKFTKIIAQVETAETVNESTAFYKWGPYAELAPLYLYVPVGKGDEALALCRRLDVPVVGIRTWRYIVGYDELDISDHYTG